MDVSNRVRFQGRLWLAGAILLGMTTTSRADALYQVIDLGTGAATLGTDASGNGTVTGSNGQSYLFNLTQSSTPSNTPALPTPVAAPVNGPGTYGDPSNAYSVSSLSAINSQGLAVGIDNYGVSGHQSDSEAFVTQLQPNGTWGPVTSIWAASNLGLGGLNAGGQGIGILGISQTGQVLGYGNVLTSSSYTQSPFLYLYDTRTQTLTNLTALIDGTTSPSGANWVMSNLDTQIDAQGRILISYGGEEGLATNSPHSLLLVAEGLPTVDPAVAPEPATWAIFASLIGGWAVHRRLRARVR